MSLDAFTQESKQFLNVYCKIFKGIIKNVIKIYTTICWTKCQLKMSNKCSGKCSNVNNFKRIVSGTPANPPSPLYRWIRGAILKSNKKISQGKLFHLCIEGSLGTYYMGWYANSHQCLSLLTHVVCLLTWMDLKRRHGNLKMKLKYGFIEKSIDELSYIKVAGHFLMDIE